MTTHESKQQYEGAILNQLVKNAERIAVVERDISEIKKIRLVSKLLCQKYKKQLKKLGL